MSFGQELKEFVAGFSAGYKMVDSKDDRDFKRARTDYYRSLAAKGDREQASLDEANRRIAGVGGGGGGDGKWSPIPAADYDVEKARHAISSIESQGDYGALGKPIKRKDGSVDRAYGKYQVMGSNIPQWTKEALGKSITPAEFLRDKTAQEKVFAHRFGQYVKQTGSVTDAASMWFTGRPANAPGNPSDGMTTKQGYLGKFYSYYGAAKGGGTSAPNVAAPGTPPPEKSGWRDPKELPSAPQKNMPEPDQDTQRSAAIDGGFGGFGEFGGWEPTQMAAGGGAIEDPTEITDEFAAKNNMNAQSRAELQGARKAAISTAEAQGRTPELASNVGPSQNPDDYPLGNALDSGLKFIQKAFGLGQRPAVAGSDPQRQQGVTAFAAGAGGSEEDTAAAENAVRERNPDLPPGQVVERTVKEVGRKFKDDPEKAGRAVGTLLQTYRQRTMAAGQQAMKQVQSGDMIGALNTLKTAYDNVPDGNTVVFEPVADAGGETTGYVYKQLDGKGKVVAEGPVTMQALAQQAKLAAGGMAFDQMIVQAAKPAQAASAPAATPGAAIPSAPAGGAPEGAGAAPAPATEAPASGAPASTEDPDAAPPATQRVTQAQPTTATDGQEPEAEGPAEPNVAAVRLQKPQPFSEPPPEQVSTAGLSGEGLKQAVAYNKSVLAEYNARKKEWDTNERARVQRLFEIEKAAALSKDSDARREKSARDLATRQATQNRAIAERTAAGQENAARIAAEGRTQAEAIKVEGDRRTAERKRLEETEKSDPNWQRNRRLRAEADPLDERAAVAGQSPISMQDSANLSRAAEGRRAAIAYENADQAPYAKVDQRERMGTVSQEIANIDAKRRELEGQPGKSNPEMVRRFSILADRVLQRNNIPVELAAGMVYGMITNRWDDNTRPRVMRDGSISYAGERIVMPPEVLQTIIAENGRRAIETDRAAIQQRDTQMATDQANREKGARRAIQDLDAESTLVREGSQAGSNLRVSPDYNPTPTPPRGAVPKSDSAGRWRSAPYRPRD